jgi:hypothetical protein
MYSDDDGILDTNPKAHVMERWKLPLAYDHGVNPRDSSSTSTAISRAELPSHQDGKLWTDFGENMDEEYFPSGSETFFVKNDLGSVAFVRDAQGHVTGYTYHRWDGQEIHARKIR